MNARVHLFCGYDPREDDGYKVFLASVAEHSSVPVVIHRMDSQGMPEGTNAFTFSRFLVPYLRGFSGRAIFADASDMLLRADPAELDALFDPSKAVQVVQHAYTTRHPRKYIGTDMECHNRDYQRKNWASLMLINCEHPAWHGMTPERLECWTEAPSALLGLRWIQDDHIGALPNEWNRLVDEGQAVDGAKLLHWTAGIPAFAHYRDAPGADLWFEQQARAWRNVERVAA
jgi:hypothetical protein